MLEPASFDVKVAPNECLQVAVERCPPGGSVLLLPGRHRGPLVLVADREVHVFGRGQATLQAAFDVFTSYAVRATADGLIVRQEESSKPGLFDCVAIQGGALRLQACDIIAVSATGIKVSGAGTNPVIAECRHAGGRLGESRFCVCVCCESRS